MKIWLNERAQPEDDGDGGVGRVVRAQQEWFPRLGHEFVEDPGQADVLVAHITIDSKLIIKSQANSKIAHPEKPLVAHIHGLYWQEYEWDAWCHKANEHVLGLIKAADVVTAPTEWVANAIRRHTNREVHVVPHGVDLDDWAPVPRAEGVPDYIYWDKTRPDPICDPAPVYELARRFPNLQFVTTFGFDQPMRNVAVIGKQPYERSRDVMKGAAVYLATTRETFGISTLQAMAAGVPIVGFDWGGQHEFVRGGGILVEPGDYDALASALTEVMNNQNSIGEEASHIAQQIGEWQPIMDQYIDIYDRARVIANPINRPRVSIIVPAYGLEDYLVDTLESVVRQTDSRWECIIVDDASPDRCGAIADEWAERDERFRVIHNETNQYLAGARNTGISAARGRYILPLDADDMLAPNAVQILGDALDADRSLHVAYGGVYFVDEDGVTPTDYGHHQGPGWSGWPLPFSHHYQAQERNMLPYSSMFRREAWRLTGGYRTRLRTAEDADFWLRLSSYGFDPRMVTTAAMLIYRNRESSMSRTEGPADWTLWFSWGKQYRRQPPAGSWNGDDQNSTGHPTVPSLNPSAVAVVIPVGLGHEGIVRDAIDSVESQTFPFWDCVVVNDSGHDLGPLPQWVRLLETPSPGSGAAVARNIGIEASPDCQWFLPLDADDLLQPEALEILVAIGMAQPEVVIYPDFYEDPIAAGEFSVYELDDYDPRAIVRNGAIHTVTALTPRKIWVDVGGYPSGVAWEDWAFQILAGEAGYCSRRVASPLFTYRKHTGQRRSENHAARAESEHQIRQFFDDRFWSGGIEIMACKSCPGGRTTTIAGSFERSAQQATAQEGVLIEYVGRKGGNFSVRGSVSRTPYRVAPGHPFYVTEADAPGFLSHQDYKAAQTATVDDSATSPRLDAPGASVPILGATPQDHDVSANGAGVGAQALGPNGCVITTKAREPCKGHAIGETQRCPRHTEKVPA